MLLAPPHSSTSRWPQSAHVVLPASHTAQHQQQPLTSVAAGKRSMPHVPVGWAKRKRSSAAYEEEHGTESCLEDAQVTKRSRYVPLSQQSSTSIGPPRPSLTSRAAYSSSTSGTSVAVASASAWKRVPTPFGAKYERAADRERDAHSNKDNGAEAGIDMDCDMDFSAPVTPPDTPCGATDATTIFASLNHGTLWSGIEGDVEMQPEQASSFYYSNALPLTSPQGRSPPPAWLRLQVSSAAHPHPYATPSPSPGTLDASYFPPSSNYDVAQRAHMGAGYFSRAV